MAGCVVVFVSYMEVLSLQGILGWPMAQASLSSPSPRLCSVVAFSVESLTTVDDEARNNKTVVFP